MDNNDNLWVDRRLETLAPRAGWQPDSGTALTRLRQRERAANVTRKRRIWLALTPWAACLAFAAPLSWNRIFPPRVETQPSNTTVTIAHAPTTFRETGSPHAPVVCEIYSDYQCPPCAAVFLETVPLLTTEYVQ